MLLSSGVTHQCTKGSTSVTDSLSEQEAHGPSPRAPTLRGTGQSAPRQCDRAPSLQRSLPGTGRPTSWPRTASSRPASPWTRRLCPGLGIGCDAIPQPKPTTRTRPLEPSHRLPWLQAAPGSVRAAASRSIQGCPAGAPEHGPWTWPSRPTEAVSPRPEVSKRGRGPQLLLPALWKPACRRRHPGTRSRATAS